MSEAVFAGDTLVRFFQMKNTFFVGSDFESRIVPTRLEWNRTTMMRTLLYLRTQDEIYNPEMAVTSVKNIDDLDSTIIALRDTAEMLQHSLTQLMLAGDAAAGAGVYAPSRFCTELPIIGSDNDAISWVRLTKVLAGFLLLVCRSLIDFCRDEQVANGDDNQRRVSDYEREAGVLRTCVKEFFDIAAILLEECMTAVMHQSRTSCLYSLESLVAARLENYVEEVSLDDQGLSDWKMKFQASAFRTGNAVISLTESMKRDVQSGHLNDASLHRLNSVIVTTVVFRAYTMLLVRKVHSD